MFLYFSSFRQIILKNSQYLSEIFDVICRLAIAEESLSREADMYCCINVLK